MSEQVYGRARGLRMSLEDPGGFLPDMDRVLMAMQVAALERIAEALEKQVKIPPLVILPPGDWGDDADVAYDLARDMSKAWEDALSASTGTGEESRAGDVGASDGAESP